MFVIDESKIVGNILGACELRDGFVVTSDFVQEYVDALVATLSGHVDVRFSMERLADVCETEYEKYCVYDTESRSFRRSSAILPIRSVSGDCDVMYAVYLNAFTNWFIVRKFKNDARDLRDYVHGSLQSASFMMDCIR